MKILLMGECSNLHWTLAQGLRSLNHDVTVASDGSKWMNNQRDINLWRKGYDLLSSFEYAFMILKNLRKFKGYDIVQIKNPIFITMRPFPNKLLFNFLKKYNKKIFLGSFGNDYVWIDACLDRKTFRYSDYYVGNTPTDIPMALLSKDEWFTDEKKNLNIYTAGKSNGIIACLYEYYEAYKKEYSEKLVHIAEPINLEELEYKNRNPENRPLRFFIGMQKDRSQVKGTDIMLEALQEVHALYPNDCSIQIVESVPYAEYVKMRYDADVILDQLYSYTPGMNALTAMAQGLVVVGGGEPEAYEILGEKTNHPIINVLPNKEDIFKKLEWLILHKDQISQLSQKSREFVEKHHDNVKVAQQYVDFWNKL